MQNFILCLKKQHFDTLNTSWQSSSLFLYHILFTCPSLHLFIDQRNHLLSLCDQLKEVVWVLTVLFRRGDMSHRCMGNTHRNAKNGFDCVWESTNWMLSVSCAVHTGFTQYSEPFSYSAHRCTAVGVTVDKCYVCWQTEEKTCNFVTSCVVLTWEQIKICTQIKM